MPLNRYHSQLGFTLLELVLVLFLVGLLASAGLLFTENQQDQAYFDETQRRMELVKHAIVGDTRRTISNRPEVSGFISDVGRLPLCLKELVTLGEVVDEEKGYYKSPCNDAENDIRIWQLNPNTGTGSGWRGSYLDVSQEDGVSTFRDGYNNVDADPVLDELNYGWQSFVSDPVTGDVEIVSNGFDLTSSSDDIGASLITLNDYTVALGSSWQTLSAVIDLDDTTKDWSFRVKLSYPVDGAPDSWPATEAERDVNRSLSSVFPNLNIASVDNSKITVSLTDIEKIKFTPAASKEGDEITLFPGTMISYSTVASPTSDDFIDEYRVVPNCINECTIEISNLVEGDGSYLEVTPSASSELVASTNVIAFVVSDLSKHVIYVPDGSSITGSTLTLPNNATITLPAGSSSTILYNTVVLAEEAITVSEPFILNNNVVRTSLSDDVFVVPSGTVMSGSDLFIPASLSLPIGIHTLTVVCESNGYVYADASCEEANFSNNTKEIVAIPRTSGPVKPEPFFWGGL